MSYKVFFSFSWSLAKALTVPEGFRAAAIAHVVEVERVLGLKRINPSKENIEACGPNYPARWDRIDYSFEEDDDRMCKIIEDHNAWVRQKYQEFEDYSKTPFVPTHWIKGSEELTPYDASEFWHGLEILTVPIDRWSKDYYRARMESVFEVMRGRPTEGVEFDAAKALTQQQAGAVINLFSEFLDAYDLRLDVVQQPGRGFNGQDRLASSYDGGYTWCDGCSKPIDYDCIGQCKRRNCPLLKVEREND